MTTPTDEALIEQMVEAMRNAPATRRIVASRVDAHGTLTHEQISYVATDEDKARAALAIARKAIEAEMRGEWQPIETAPKDCDVLLGSGRTEAGGPWVTVGRWDEDSAAFWEKNNHPTDYWGSEIYPTKWQPLPKEPV